MKRSKPLIRLSKEHHQALLHAWKIKQGIKKGIANERIRRYITWFYQTHLLPHFQAEEQYIFSILAPAHRLRLQAMAEHEELRALVERMNSDINETALGLYAHLLEQHIRFEERELFNYLQENHMQELSNVLSIIQDKDVLADDFMDEFWV